MPRKKSKVDEKLLAFESATLTPSQEKFIKKHMNGGGLFKRKEALRNELEALYNTVTLHLETVENDIAEMSRLVTNKHEADTVGAIRMRRGDIVGSIGVTAKNLDDALNRLRSAKAELDVLVRDSAKARKSFTTVDGTESSQREAILKLRVDAEGKLRDILRSWHVGYDQLVETMNQKAPGARVNLPPEADLRIKFREHFAKLPDLPTKMDGGVDKAAQEFDALVRQMSQDHDTARSRLDEYAKDTFELDTKVAALYVALDRRLSDFDALTDKLDMWGIEEAEDLQGEAAILQGRIELLGNGKVDPSDVKDEFQSIEEEIADLTKIAKRLVAKAESEFNSLQADLQSELQDLEKRLSDLDKKALPEEQRAPIEKFLAATSASINKLGGSNPSALAAARIMLVDAEKQVAQAEDIGPVNDEIKSRLERSKELLKTLTSKSSTVAELASDLDERVTKFEGAWLKMPPDQARKDAGSLHDEVVDLDTRNSRLIENRAEAAEALKLLEKKYEAFNGLFKDAQESRGAPKSKDYRGPIRGEIDGIATWNATKLDPTFHSTIMGRIDKVSAQLDELMTGLRATVGSTDEELDKRVQAAKDLLDQALRDGSGEEDIAKLRAAYEQALGAKGALAALTKDVDDAEAQEQKYVDDRAEFLESAKDWIGETKSKIKNAKAGEAFNLYKDEVERQIVRIEATVKAAKKDKKGPTGARGLSELRDVGAAVQRIEARGGSTDPKKLDQIDSNWDEAVRDFLENADRLADALAAFENETGIGDAASRKLDVVLRDIYGRMAVTRFDEAGKILGTNEPPKSAQERKAGREIALSEVRRIRKAVIEDPVVKSCIANPFGIAGFASLTVARLEQIELDVLRGD